MTFDLLRKTRRVAAAVGLVIALTALGGLGTAVAQSSSGGSGPLRDLQPADPAPTDSAAADLAISAVGGSTTLRLAVRGLDAPVDTAYGANLHYGTCLTGDPAAAGPRFNDTGEPALRSGDPHEVTLDFAVTIVGTGLAETTVPFVIPTGKANSLVITDADGVRVACLPVTVLGAVESDEVLGISETALAEPDTLAFTGTQPDHLAAIGLSLVGSGAVALIWRRRIDS